MTTAHQAASLDDARLAAWTPAPGSADADTLNELPIITPRSRDLVRNNPIASGARQTLNDNIVGHQLRLSPQPKYKLLGHDKNWASQCGKNTTDQFDTWADTVECDAGRSLTFLGLTTQALSGAFMNGDAIALLLWDKRPGDRWATKIQLIESDRLNTPPWVKPSAKLRGGIEIDDYGAPVAYWIQINHPGDRYGAMLSWRPDDWERVPAFTRWGRRRVIHLHGKERSGQSRGKPIFTAVMREFRMEASIWVPSCRRQ